MIEVCFCEKAHFYFTPPPHHPRTARRVCHFFGAGNLGMVRGIGIFVGEFLYW